MDSTQTNAYEGNHEKRPTAGNWYLAKKLMDLTDATELYGLDSRGLITVSQVAVTQRVSSSHQPKLFIAELYALS